MTKNQKIFFAIFLVLGFILIFFRLSRHDMLGDDAHYAFRSVGYFDYMASEEQTTPVQWFRDRPSWSLLSFHDHPPLTFLIQHIFFRIFGVSVFVARLPAALAAFGSILAVFFLGKRIGGARTGLLAMAALSVNSYFIWTGRVGLLESVFVFFLIVGILYLVKSLQGGTKYFPLSGFFFGLSFLAKYTFLFMIPAIFIYLMWKERWIFRNKKFWLGVLLFLILASPIVIYNLNMYSIRGHFDVQFADFFGQSNSDWSNLGNRVAGSSFSPSNVFTTLQDGFSWPYFYAFLSSFVASVYLAWKKKEKYIFIPLLAILSFFAFFSIVGGSARWMGVLGVFVALTIGYALNSLSESTLYKKFRWGFAALALLLAGFSAFYTLNTNTFKKPVGSSQFYSNHRIENVGYNQLDEKIAQIVGGAGVPPVMQETVRLWWYKNLNKDDLHHFQREKKEGKSFNSIIIYDSNTEWFPTLWIFERQKLYRGFLMPTAAEYLKIVQSETGIQALQALNLDGIYLVRAAQNVSERSEIKFPEIELLVENFENQKIDSEVVYNDKGEEAFYIYHGSFK